MSEEFDKKMNNQRSGAISEEHIYDTLNNAFLSYRSAKNPSQKVTSRLSHAGEEFIAGRFLIGKIGYNDGAIRLFVDVDPGFPNNYPHVLNVHTQEQLNYSLQLIDTVMHNNGYEIDPYYVPRHSTADYQNLLTTGGLEEQPDIINARLPVYATVLDKYGQKIGKVRRSVWYNADGQSVGKFIKDDANVYFYGDSEKSGIVDKNNNVLTLGYGYIATVRYARLWIAALIAALLVLIILMSTITAAFYLTSSSSTDYPPTLFVVDEGDNDWSHTENIPVFFNDQFGDNVIAPGQSGKYAFRFINYNHDQLDFSIEFSCENEYNIDLIYRLKRDGLYVCGDEDHYVTIDELNLYGMTIQPHGDPTVFELEWYWRDNDEIDTIAGENQAQYYLHITITAGITKFA